MTVTTSTLPPRKLFGVALPRPLLAVWDGDHLLGWIEQDERGDWQARPLGGWFAPMPRGLRMEAIEFLEVCAGMPSGYRRPAPPPRPGSEGIGE